MSRSPSDPSADRTLDRPPAEAEGRPFEDADETLIAILGNSQRRGAWSPPGALRVICVLGGARLDFREADLLPGETEIDVVTCGGDVELIVPASLEVELSGSALFGGLDTGLRRRGPRWPRFWRSQRREPELVDDEDDPPRLRVRGLALLGHVRVTLA